MKIAASVLIVVAILNLIGGVFFGFIIISEYNQSETGWMIIFASIMFNFGLLALAEIGINVATLRNIAEEKEKQTKPKMEKPTASQNKPTTKPGPVEFDAKKYDPDKLRYGILEETKED